MQEELQRNYDNVTAYVKNGIANQADLDAVKVEQLNNIQQRHTLEATYRAYSEMLKIMINHPTPLTGNTLKKPDVNALLYKGEAYSADSSDVRNLTCLRHKISNWRRNVNNLPPRTCLG